VQLEFLQPHNMKHIYTLKQYLKILFIAIFVSVLSVAFPSVALAQCPTTCNISTPVTISSDCNITCATFEVKAGGNLTIRGNSTFTIIGDATFFNQSIVTVESGSTLIISGDLTNNNNSSGITINGLLQVGGTLQNGVGGGGNSTAIVGTGSIRAGEIDNKNGATLFGVQGPAANCTTTADNPCIKISPLPIVLKQFLINVIGNSVRLTWITSSEINNDFFTIERSADGINFIEISHQAGAGNSIEELSYSAVDMRPLSGRSYYRLKQTDYDGTFDYSPVQSVFINDGTTSINIFPNPASSQTVTLLVSGQKGENAQISISTLTGKLVDQQLVQIKEQSEELVINGSTQLKQGVYIVTYKSASASTQQKLVIR
jgi:hypothetical protein